MIPSTRRPRLAVVSPFLDKHHGTERRVVEWVSQLANAFEIHVYSQRVEDLDLQKIAWHRIPKLPGPHVLNFIWWFFANHLWRSWDRIVRGLRSDLVFSPGINCLDADAISVHIVFSGYVQKNRDEMILARRSFRDWPRLLHRKLYYRLLIVLEHRIYTRRDNTLILIARRTGEELKEFYARDEPWPVVYLGLDHEKFHAERRLKMRVSARQQMGLAPDSFALLLIGNDWRNKGVPVVLDALAQLRHEPVHLLFVSREDAAAARAMVRERGLEGRVQFLPPREEVEFYYAAADAYAGPSLEDTFAQPPAEAMACGLPVIVSAMNGTAEIITHGVDGLILDDPRDAMGLAEMIRKIREDAEFRTQLGEKAALTAQQYTWRKNGYELGAIFEDILRRKAGAVTQTLAQGL